MRRLLIVFSALTLGLILMAAQPQEDLANAVSAYWDAQFDSAESLLQRIDPAELLPTERLVYLKILAATQHAKGNSDAAKATFDDLIELDPAFKLSTSEFAPLLVELFDAAKRDAANEQFKLGITEYSAKSYQAAVEHLENSLALQPDDPTTHQFLTLARDAMQRPNQPAGGDPDPASRAEPVEEIADPSSDLPLVTAISPSHYETGVLQPGVRAYVDKKYIISAIPEPLLGNLFIKSVNEDKILFRDMTVDISRPATVYIAHDRRVAKKPDWLGRFSRTSTWLRIIETGAAGVEQVYDLYRRDVEPGSLLLGPNIHRETKNPRRSSMYIVLVIPR